MISYKQENASDENGVPVQMTLKTIEQGKRSAEGSPDNVPSRKRAAFGDITNVSELKTLVLYLVKYVISWLKTERKPSNRFS